MFHNCIRMYFHHIKMIHLFMLIQCFIYITQSNEPSSHSKISMRKRREIKNMKISWLSIDGDVISG